MNPTFDPAGWTVGYGRDGIASIGQLHMADLHKAADVGAWVTCEPEPMTMDAALKIMHEVNAGIQAAKAAARSCPTCGRMVPQ